MYLNGSFQNSARQSRFGRQSDFKGIVGRFDQRELLFYGFVQQRIRRKRFIGRYFSCENPFAAFEDRFSFAVREIALLLNQLRRRAEKVGAASGETQSARRDQIHIVEVSVFIGIEKVFSAGNPQAFLAVLHDAVAGKRRKPLKLVIGPFQAVVPQQVVGIDIVEQPVPECVQSVVKFRLTVKPYPQIIERRRRIVAGQIESGIHVANPDFDRNAVDLERMRHSVGAKPFASDQIFALRFYGAVGKQDTVIHQQPQRPVQRALVSVDGIA